MLVIDYSIWVSWKVWSVVERLSGEFSRRGAGLPKRKEMMSQLLFIFIFFCRPTNPFFLLESARETKHQIGMALV